jgi:hypothetical protein
MIKINFEPFTITISEIRALADRLFGAALVIFRSTN